MRARTATIIGSALFHVLLGAGAVYYAGRPKAHKAQTVAVMGDKKEKPKPKDTPPHPPKPKLASRAVEPIVAEPLPIKETAPRPPVAPSSPGTMSNEGGTTTPGTNGSATGNGNGNGTGTGGGNGNGGAKPGVATKKPLTGDDECTEAPTKAQPVNRATEIEYTQQARQDGIEGRLVLKVVVGADGSVSDVIVVSSVDPALDAAAIAAVKTWVFQPASRCGKPMAGGTYTLAQRFELGD